jgi:hypothetical protein
MRRRLEVERTIRRWRLESHGGPPTLGLERTPELIRRSLVGVAAQTARSGAELAVLELGAGRCGTALDELDRVATDVRWGAAAAAVGAARSRRRALDPALVARLAATLADLATENRNTASWWCRSTGCKRDMHGVGGALRDAARALSDAVEALDGPAADREAAIADIERRTREGKRLVRRARTDAVLGDDVLGAIGRLRALASADRALRSCADGALILRQLVARRG